MFKGPIPFKKAPAGYYDSPDFPEGTRVLICAQGWAWKVWPDGRLELNTANAWWIREFIRGGDWIPAAA